MLLSIFVSVPFRLFLLIAFVFGSEIFKFLRWRLTVDYSVGVPLFFAGLCRLLVSECIPMDFGFSVYPPLRFTFGWFSHVFQLLLLVIVLLWICFCCFVIVAFV